MSADVHIVISVTSFKDRLYIGPSHTQVNDAIQSIFPSLIDAEYKIVSDGIVYAATTPLYLILSRAPTPLVSAHSTLFSLSAPAIQYPTITVTLAPTQDLAQLATLDQQLYTSIQHNNIHNLSLITNHDHTAIHVPGLAPPISPSTIDDSSHTLHTSNDNSINTTYDNDDDQYTTIYRPRRNQDDNSRQPSPPLPRNNVSSSSPQQALDASSPNSLHTSTATTPITEYTANTRQYYEQPRPIQPEQTRIRQGPWPRPPYPPDHFSSHHHRPISLMNLITSICDKCISFTTKCQDSIMSLWNVLNLPGPPYYDTPTRPSEHFRPRVDLTTNRVVDGPDIHVGVSDDEIPLDLAEWKSAQALRRLKIAWGIVIILIWLLSYIKPILFSLTTYIIMILFTLIFVFYITKPKEICICIIYIVKYLVLWLPCGTGQSLQFLDWILTLLSSASPLHDSVMRERGASTSTIQRSPSTSPSSSPSALSRHQHQQRRGISNTQNMTRQRMIQPGSTTLRSRSSRHLHLPTHSTTQQVSQRSLSRPRRSSRSSGDMVNDTDPSRIQSRNIENAQPIDDDLHLVSAYGNLEAN